MALLESLASQSLRLLTVALVGLVLAACGSTPPPEGAPIEDRTLGSKSSPTGPSGPTAGTVASGGVAQIDLTNPRGPAGAPRELTIGELAKRSVYFEYDSNAIADEYRGMLQAHAGYLQRNRATKMLVQGNTDERGGREYNLALGQRRAEAIKRTLVLLGAQDGQIEAVSLGEEKPKLAGSTEEAYRENRRGDILYASEQ